VFLGMPFSWNGVLTWKNTDMTFTKWLSLKPLKNTPITWLPNPVFTLIYTRGISPEKVVIVFNWPIRAHNKTEYNTNITNADDFTVNKCCLSWIGTQGMESDVIVTYLNDDLVLKKITMSTILGNMYRHACALTDKNTR